MFGIFRKKDARELLAEAEALFASGRFGDAKLMFDRAEERAQKDGQGELTSQAEERAALSCDRIAEARIQEAQALARAGDLDAASDELKHAMETARSAAVQERIARAQRLLEQKDAREAAAAPLPLSDEERLILITGSWEPLQAKELESYGEPLLTALLAVEDARASDAVQKLEAILESTKQPSYLWLELGRARLVAGDEAGATEALRTFLSRIGPEEGGAPRITAHRELARIAHEAGNKEEAIDILEACAAALENDPRPYLDLGNYLRLVGRPTEAIEVLELCASLFQGQVEWPVTMELGLACADAGDDGRAVDALEQVLKTLGAGGNKDFPPPAVTALAKLHEKRENLTRAADLYRALCEGSDVENHAVYHREAARLLDAVGLAEEAQRMRTRAEGLELPA